MCCTSERTSDCILQHRLIMLCCLLSGITLSTPESRNPVSELLRIPLSQPMHLSSLLCQHCKEFTSNLLCSLMTAIVGTFGWLLAACSTLGRSQTGTLSLRAVRAAFILLSNANQRIGDFHAAHFVMALASGWLPGPCLTIPPASSANPLALQTWSTSRAKPPLQHIQQRAHIGHSKLSRWRSGTCDCEA